MNNVPLVHSVYFVFVRPFGSSVRHAEDPSQAPSPAPLDSAQQSEKMSRNMKVNSTLREFIASHEKVYFFVTFHVRHKRSRLEIRPARSQEFILL